MGKREGYCRGRARLNHDSSYTRVPLYTSPWRTAVEENRTSQSACLNSSRAQSLTGSTDRNIVDPRVAASPRSSTWFNSDTRREAICIAEQAVARRNSTLGAGIRCAGLSFSVGGGRGVLFLFECCGDPTSDYPSSKRRSPAARSHLTYPFTAHAERDVAARPQKQGLGVGWRLESRAHTRRNRLRLPLA